MEVVKPKLVVDVKLEPSAKPRWTLADALLADLETTATPRSIYETKFETNTTTEHFTVSPPSSTVTPQSYIRHQSHSPEPPPLPPLPPKEVLDSLHNSQEFRGNRSPGQPVYSSTITISKSVYNGDGEQLHRSRSLSPAIPRLDSSSSSANAQYGYESRPTGIPRLTPNATKSAQLSNNLSELDSLLEDLSSTKLIDEVNRNAVESPYPSGTLRSQTGSRSGTLQREQEIPKLIVPSVQEGPGFSNYDDVESYRTDTIHGSGGVVHGPFVEQSQFYEVQTNVIPTNVQQPPIQQLHPGQSETQFMTTSPSPTFQRQQDMFLQQQEQQQMQQMPVPVGSVVQQQQSLGQGPGLYEGLGQSPYSQTTVETYTEQRFIPPQQTVNLPPQQHFRSQTISQEVSQPQQQFASQTALHQGGQGRATSATKDLEQLMASFSEFDVNKGDPQYAQPMKTRQASSSSSDVLGTGDNVDASKNSQQQQQMTTSYLSTSSSSQGLYDGVSPGSISPSPHEMIIQPSPSAVGHPVPATVYSQNQSSSKMVVTQGMHAQSGSGQAGDGQLEMMLGKLGSDLSQQGILTLPKGDCAACSKAIVGQVLMALGKLWHPEHFVCVHCRHELGTNIFFERDGQPYCENDYQVLFSPKCALCGGAILEKCITALDKTWHPEHFFCAQCQHPFGEEGFHEQNGLPFCSEDYFRMFAPKCGGCGNAILSNYVRALHRQWHPECFVCRECHAPFVSGSFYDHNGLPYCEEHFHKQRGSSCAACQQPITGRCIAAMYRKFHPEHFVCVFCLQPLNKGTFKEHSDKPYCHQCFEKLFG